MSPLCCLAFNRFGWGLRQLVDCCRTEYGIPRNEGCRHAPTDWSCRRYDTQTVAGSRADPRQLCCIGAVTPAPRPRTCGRRRKVRMTVLRILAMARFPFRGGGDQGGRVRLASDTGPHRLGGTAGDHGRRFRLAVAAGHRTRRTPRSSWATSGSPRVCNGPAPPPRRCSCCCGLRRTIWAIGAWCGSANALNGPSKRAAGRLGFTYEGSPYERTWWSKGRLRDTDWYSIVGDEWPRCRDALLTWLDPANFGADGTAKRGLAELRSELYRG